MDDPEELTGRGWVRYNPPTAAELNAAAKRSRRGDYDDPPPTPRYLNVPLPAPPAAPKFQAPSVYIPSHKRSSSAAGDPGDGDRPRSYRLPGVAPGDVPPVVRNPANAIFDAADGEPFDTRGVITYKLGNDNTLSMKWIDIQFVDYQFGGHLAQEAIPLSEIPLGTGPGFRQGRKVNLTAYEYRLTIRNDQFKLENMNEPIEETTWTRPPMVIGANSWYTQFYDSATNSAVKLTNDLVGGAILAWPAVPPGVGPAAFITDLDAAQGPDENVEITPEVADLVNRQPLPVFHNAHGPEGGELPSTRFLFFIDNNAQSFYQLSGAYPTGFDILAPLGTMYQEYTIADGLYSLERLNRFGVVEDTTWSTESTKNMMLAQKPAKRVSITTIYNDSLVAYDSIDTGAFFFLPGSNTFPNTSENILPYTLNGWIRVFYRDN